MVKNGPVLESNNFSSSNENLVRRKNSEKSDHCFFHKIQQKTIPSKKDKN